MANTALPVLCLTLAFATAATAQTTAEGAVPLSELLRMVEADGTRTIYSAEQERQGWEVVSCAGRSRDCQEDMLDPVTGAVLDSESEGVATLPPEGALPASDVAALVEGLNAGVITELEFDDGEWEVDTRAGDGSEAEFKIDPTDGTVRRCQGRACP